MLVLARRLETDEEKPSADPAPLCRRLPGMGIPLGAGMPEPPPAPRTASISYLLYVPRRLGVRNDSPSTMSSSGRLCCTAPLMLMLIE